MANDQNEIECFKIETNIRVTARAEIEKHPHPDSGYRQASQSPVPRKTGK
ncbi:hypothetical protein [Janthinobacterium sp. 1_2014MBL_MicDiv]|nr:hypothetical protein [Janthinobacterium sp. 1_2014MBL_MicDiv]